LREPQFLSSVTDESEKIKPEFLNGRNALYQGATTGRKSERVQDQQDGKAQELDSDESAGRRMNIQTMMPRTRMEEPDDECHGLQSVDCTFQARKTNF
jgi:hypothetical protein